MTEITVMLISYLFLMTAIGVYSFFKAKTTSDFYVSGKKGTWWQITGSLYATIIGGSAILGTVELAQKAGWAAVWFLGSAALGLFLLAFIAPRVRQLGRFTLPEMIRLFYGTSAEKTSGILIPVAWLGIIAVQIIGGGKILAALQLMTYQQGALVSTVIFILYTLLGGQKSILKTDVVQTIIILVVLGLLFFLKLKGPSGHTGQETVALFNSGFKPLDLIILLLTYSVTFVVGPDMYSRIFCARNDRTARISVLVTALLILVTAFLLTSLGQANPGDRPADQDRLIFPGQGLLPDWATGLLLVMMLSAIMSSAATTLLTASIILSGLVYRDLGNRRSLRLTRGFIVITGLLSLVIATCISSVLSALLLSLSFFSGAFIVPVLAGIKGWKVNRERAFAAMIAGGLTALAGKIIQEFLHMEWGYGVIVAAYLVNAWLLFSPGRNNPLDKAIEN